MLGTGIVDPKNCPETIRISRQRIKLRKHQGNPLQAGEDVRLHGHGSKVASILLKTAPYADLYIYRVLHSNEDKLERSVVTRALVDAIESGVDLVNMSFGWAQKHGKGDQQLDDALNLCRSSHVLVFAATNNDGIGSSMSFPAWDAHVISIDAAAADGKFLVSNPGCGSTKKARLAALGEQSRLMFLPISMEHTMVV